MIREARGFFDEEGVLHAAPRIRIGISFGRDRVIATPALVDTGSDVCVLPPDIVPWPLPDGPTMAVIVEGVGREPFPATAYFPTITAGDLRIPGVATVLLPGVEPILGRIFLNACAVHLSAKRQLVRLRASANAGPDAPRSAG